ncbi:putative GspC [Desulfamplus magnetovallimortis]|uniref:Putative GspC n=1 Tax=Desulfamplus magnetovallimortis TaxID=1246637 RepID=A0A1W1HL75_9BACT|nr:type II secretion system protein GspC [Desulfamplus magnetovallimortis]SLM33229.1 putative GspC [Desulfamplus magnetovallimortis]
MKLLFHILNTLFLTLAIFLLVETLYKGFEGKILTQETHIQSSPNSRLKSVDTTIPNSIVKSISIAHYDAIKKRNLFKTSSEAMNSEKKEETDDLSDAEIESLEKTTLNIKLWGTVKGGDTENYAVIENASDRKQGLYRQGEIIEGTSAVIRKVLRMSVIINNNGKDQVLEMSSDVSASNISTSSGILRNTAATSTSVDRGEDDDKIEMTIQRSMIEESMQDINNLMKQVRIRPHFTGGEADGILLYGIKQSSMFNEMGIRNGDIIMGVDGNAIRSVEDAIGLYDTLQNASEAKIQIKRRGRTKEILYHVE